MSIEVTMRHSDVRIESLKDYAQKRMEKLQVAFPKVTKVSIVIDVDVKKHMYMAEVVANRLGETATLAGIGAKVRVYNKTRDMEIEYSIVSSIEANPLARKISDHSPIGNALVGAKVGDTVKADTPSGVLELEILEISRA